jgi:translocation and assembly module TamB
MVEGRVTGPFADPAAAGTLLLADLDIAGQRIGRAVLGFDLSHLASEPQGHLALDAGAGGRAYKLAVDARLRQPRMLDLSKLTASGPGITAKGDVTLDIERLLVRGRASIDVADLAPMTALLGVPGSGRAMAALQLDDAGQRQRVVADLKAQALRAEGVTVDRAEGRVTIDDALGKARGEVSLKATGVAAAGARLRDWQLSARGDRTQARFETSLAGDAGGPLTARATGTVGIAGARWQVGLQSLEARHGEIPVRLEAPTTISGEPGTLRLADTALAVDRTGIRLGGGMAAGKVDAYLRSDAMPLSLMRVVDPAFPVQGHLGIDVRMAGSVAAPQVTASIRSADLRPRRSDLTLALDLDIAIRDGRLEAKANVGNLADTPLVATVAAPVRFGLQPWQLAMAAEGPISGRAEGNVDLPRVLPPFLPDGDVVAGVAAVSLTLGGTVAQPNVRGGLKMSGGRYENAVLEAAVSALALDIAGDGNAVKLSARGTDGEAGTIAAEGTVTLADTGAGGRPLTGRVSLRNFWVARRADASVRMAGDVDLSGTVGAPHLAGKLDILQAELQLPEQLPPEVVRLDVVEINLPPSLDARRRQPPSGDAGAAMPIGLDIAVAADRRVFVRGRGLESEWRGSLRIRGDSNAPDIAGSLEAIKGQLDFIGQRFVLTKGRLLFPGGTRIDPDLDVVTEVTRGDLVAIVSIGGTMSAPSLALSARPDMPPEEVISRMLFERGTARLSPLQALQVAQTALTLARGGSGGPGMIDRLRRATGLDVLDFQSGDGENAAGSVSVGMYVSDNVLLRAEQGLGDTGPQVGVEVEITPNISVESKVGGAATSAGVKIKKDY